MKGSVARKSVAPPTSTGSASLPTGWALYTRARTSSAFLCCLIQSCIIGVSTLPGHRQLTRVPSMGVVERQGLGECNDAALRGAVDDGVALPGEADHARQAHDRAARLAQCEDGHFGAEEDALEVQCQEEVPVPFGRLEYAAGDVGAGVVDQGVEPPVNISNLVEQIGYALPVGGVVAYGPASKPSSTRFFPSFSASSRSLSASTVA
jgi:hypothetical protein